MKRFFTYLLLLTVFLAACKKDFLNKLPKDKLVSETAFVDYNNFQTYAWSLYSQFGGYSEGQYPNAFQAEYVTDNLNQTQAGDMSEYAFQTKIVPAAGANTATQVPSNWNFNYIRQVNVMLDNIDQSKLSAKDKDHWRSVGYFFRALRYYDLISAFGDVPWIEHTLTDTSTNVLFAARTPRDIVAKNVLDNLLWAETHINPDGNGENTINTNVVRALMSRFCLFEGTWRKYHGLSDADTYLKACKTASEKLMETFPSIMSNYDDVFNSEDLSGQPGIILYKPYVANLTTNSNSRFAASTSWFVDMTKDAVENYLCTDGKPISTSSVYAGDKTMYNEFRNRDRRLYYSVVPPYKVKVGSPSNTWTNTSNPEDAEYITLMNTIGGTNKILPRNVWNKIWSDGAVMSMSPHFRKFNAGQSQGVGELGYFFWKFTNRIQLDNANNSTNDAPLFRMEEVLLNYAEVMQEMGLFDQAIANITINKLRKRANLPDMIVASINTGFDLNRDPSVDPVMWEIRRERRVELMGEGFRFNDLKRWEKGHYLDKQMLGVWVKNSDFNNKLTIFGGGKEGYVEFFPKPAGWLDKYYFEPLPTQDLALNSNLKQNPGY